MEFGFDFGVFAVIFSTFFLIHVSFFALFPNRLLSSLNHSSLFFVKSCEIGNVKRIVGICGNEL